MMALKTSMTRWMKLAGARSPAASTLVLMGAFAPFAGAHGGLFRQTGGSQTLPPPPSGNPNANTSSVASATARESAVSTPGSAPTLAFSEERWEFWWEFNHDAWINLRPSLRTAPTPAGGAVFTPFDAAGKAQLLLPALIELLRDDHELVRSAALYSLARLEDASTLPYLSNAAVNDTSLAVRTNAVLALGLARNPKATERLKTTFLDERLPDELRANAAVALGVSGIAEATAVLRDTLAAGPESRLPTPIRLAAIYAIGLSQDPANAPFLRSFSQSRGLDDAEEALAIESLGRVGDRAVNPLLLEALASDRVSVRRSAATALGVVARPDDADAVKGLEHAAIDDADGVVRSFAEIALGRIASNGSPAIVDRLKKLLESANARQRPFIALALGIAGYQSALPDLMALFKQESNASQRGALAIAIALLDQKEAAEELRTAFRHEKDPALRGYLAFALGRLGDAVSAPQMRELLASENDPQLLYWSSIGLGLLGDRTAPTLIEAQLEKPSGELIKRASFLHALGAIGDKTTAPFLIETAKRKSEVAYVRAFAASSLGLLCDERRLPLAATFSRDHNYTMRLSFIDELYYLF